MNGLAWRLLMATMALALSMRAEPQDPARAGYLNPDLPAVERARDLVSRMTLDEKVRQMQNAAPAIARLDVPAYDWWNEGLHGVARAGPATVFPQAIGLAATWDTDLMFRVADVISTEARAKYHEAIRTDSHARYSGLTFWSPNINIFRDPRWGRGQETYGEDPFLTGRMAVAFIKGMQGNDPRYFKVIATAKHFAVHSGPESTRHQADVHPSERDLQDTYLPAFRAAIVEGGAGSVMCAYNRLDGTPACASADLLQRRLRDDWGFRGFVVSDCGAISDIFRGHKFLPTMADAAAAAVKAGTDLTCGNEYTSLAGAVAAGQIAERELDASLERLFTARFRLGMFDPPQRVPFASIPYSVVDSSAHRRLALEAARKSIVLLTNDKGVLPLKLPLRAIALVGPSADDAEGLLGNYNGFSALVVTPLDGVSRQFPSTRIRYAPGSGYAPGVQMVISRDVLTLADGFGRGVLAEYFEGADMGVPRFSRVEARPLLPALADPALAAAGVPARGYSVRWTGSLTAPFTGEYVFGARGGPPQGMRVFLDDTDVLANATVGFGRVREGRIALEAGRRYALHVEFRPAAATPLAANVQLVWIPPAEPLLAEAVQAAASADVVVACLGLSPSLEGEEMGVNIPGFSGGDRTSLDVPAPQARLLDAIVATGKPVVVVLTSGSAVAIAGAASRARAVLAAWYGGEEIGTAIAETLAGINNPAGRLPVTFYRSVDQLPAFDDYAMKGRTYRYFSGAPLFPFGFGLSYSTFAYSALRVQRDGAVTHVASRVKNTSPRDGDEVVELYVDGGHAADDPIRSLRAFERVHLGPGETRDVAFTIGPDAPPETGARICVGGGQPIAGTAGPSPVCSRPR